MARPVAVPGSEFAFRESMLDSGVARHVRRAGRSCESAVQACLIEVRFVIS
jgi:hypothetical protein